MKPNFAKIAAILAVVIGAMAVVAGASVWLGRVPSYDVIGWLPLYNVVLGVIALFVAILLWRNSRYAMAAALATLAAHLVVTVVLLIAYREVVATASLVAMAVRIATWTLIVGLLWVQSRSIEAGAPEQNQPRGV